MELRKLVFILFFCIFMIGCETTPEIDKPLPEFSFEQEEEYILDVSSIPTINPPDFVFLKQDVKGKLEIFDPDEEPNSIPVAVAFPVDQLNRIDALLEVKDMYKDISREQEALINIERKKVEALKEMLILERQNRQLERELRLAAEDAYRRERRDHRIDNLIHRGTMVVMVIGGVAIAAL